MARTPSTTTQAFLVGGLGIGLYSVMDALMKGLAISLGAYNAALWRGLFGIVFTGVVFLTSRPRIPPAAVMRLAALVARASLVNSSVTFKILTGRPSAVSSN